MRTKRANLLVTTLFTLCSASALAQDSPSALDVTSSWPDLLAVDLTTCAELRCASVDDRACASTCDASRSAPPVCREVDCASCLENAGDGASECARDGSCGERVCVLCAWPGEGGDEPSAVCHASSSGARDAKGSAGNTASVSHAGPRVTATPAHASSRDEALRPSWALYEVKDHRYRLLTAGFLGGPTRPPKPAASTLDRTPAVRERIGKMGMLALIHASRDRADDPVAHLFTAGDSFEESVRSSLESATTEHERGGVVQASLESWPAVSDVRGLLLERTLPLPALDKRASVVTARLDRDRLIDIDGTLDTDQAARALRARRDAFQLCYENTYKTVDGPSGRLVIDLSIDRAGRVSDVFLAEDELESDPLSVCVLSTIERVRFPAHPEEELELTATLAFRQKR